MTRHTLTTVIDIDAPASVVWSVLTDLPHYADWNPLIPNAIGRIALGERLRCRPVVPGIPLPLEFHVEVTRCVEEREFAWIGKVLMAKFASGEHVFRIEPRTMDSVRLLHTEQFLGLVAPVAYRLLKGRVTRGFENMDRALKRIAEAQHRSHGESECQ